MTKYHTCGQAITVVTVLNKNKCRVPYFLSHDSMERTLIYCPNCGEYIRIEDMSTSMNIDLIKNAA